MTDVGYILGFLQIITTLLHHESTMLLALRTLSVICCRGDGDAKKGILGHVGQIVELLRSRPSNREIYEAAIITVSRAMDDPSHHSHATPEDLRCSTVRTLSVFTSLILCSLRSSYAALRNSLRLLPRLMSRFPREFDAIPDFLFAMATFLKSRHLRTRAQVLSVLLLYPEPEEQPLSMTRFFGGINGTLPTHLVDILNQYGRHRAECVVRAVTHLEWMYAMGEVERTGDLRRLGRIFAGLIRRSGASLLGSEWGVRALSEDGDSPGTPGLTTISLPFSEGSDALRHCARALRDTGTPEDLDCADILDIKLLLMNGMTLEAFTHARIATQRNPRLAYAHCVLSSVQDAEMGFAAAEKGLSLSDTTPFERRQMLWAGVTHSARKGLYQLMDESNAHRSEGRGADLLRRALDMANCYLSEAPPDSSHTPTIVGWCILLGEVLRGPDTHHDLQVFPTVCITLSEIETLYSLIGPAQANADQRGVRKRGWRTIPKNSGAVSCQHVTSYLRCQLARRGTDHEKI